jgi:hypothetical protein
MYDINAAVIQLGLLKFEIDTFFGVESSFGGMLVGEVLGIGGQLGQGTGYVTSHQFGGDHQNR